jgi:TM2 domain-containing membrane protein YozV
MAVKKGSETTPRKRGAAKIEEKAKKKTPVTEKKELLKIAEEREAPREEAAIPAPIEQEAQEQEAVETVEGKEAAKENKEKKDVQEASRKSRLVSLLLCFFLGWAGGHRFYVKKMSTALIMLFTMGGFGVWYFLDFIMIASGLFKDKDNFPIRRWI